MKRAYFNLGMAKYSKWVELAYNFSFNFEAQRHMFSNNDTNMNSWKYSTFTPLQGTRKKNQKSVKL